MSQYYAQKKEHELLKETTRKQIAKLTKQNNKLKKSNNELLSKIQQQQKKIVEPLI